MGHFITMKQKSKRAIIIRDSVTNNHFKIKNEKNSGHDSKRKQEVGGKCSIEKRKGKEGNYKIIIKILKVKLSWKKVF